MCASAAATPQALHLMMPLLHAEISGAELEHCVTLENNQIGFPGIPLLDAILWPSGNRKGVTFRFFAQRSWLQKLVLVLFFCFSGFVS
jgi:hypothetical protein